MPEKNQAKDEVFWPAIPQTFPGSSVRTPKVENFSQALDILESVSEGGKWGMGWVVVGTAVFGAPRFCIFLWKNEVFSKFLAQNWGATKKAVPTTTHPIFHLTPSEKNKHVSADIHDPKAWTSMTRRRVQKNISG